MHTGFFLGGGDSLNERDHLESLDIEGKKVLKYALKILVYKSQQDAHVTEFILSDNCYTCFGCHYHPSSGA